MTDADRPGGAPSDIELRHELTPTDEAQIARIVQATSRFRPAEIDIAVELVRENLARGDGCGYWFTLAEIDGRLVGYACCGPIPCTVTSFDLYWIAVDPDFQGRGIGKALMRDAQQRIREAGGRRVFIDTSSRPDYEPTRRFYAAGGYRPEARLTDFYAPGDDKIVYARDLA